jgi:3-methyl-2-oxobutanoate hydroxymethyltransferase
VLVFHDLLGLFDRFTPKFVKRYAELHPTILAALQAYREEVTNRTFPAEAHSYRVDMQEIEPFLAGDQQ